MTFATAIKYHGSGPEAWLEVALPAAYLPEVALLARKGWASVTLEEVKRPRSTGPKSQNNRANGFLRQIARATGNDFAAVEAACKLRALDQGYPIELVMGRWVAKSQSKLTVSEASRWIETIQQIAAEEGIALQEE